jgi:outer membrane immunogenic protein
MLRRRDSSFAVYPLACDSVAVVHCAGVDVFKVVLACLLAILLTVRFAAAADMAVKAPPPPPPSVASWTGNYFGVDLGGRWDDTHANVTSVMTGTPPVVGNFGPGESFNGASFRAGVFAGRNWQIDPHWVVGAEADWNWSHQNGSQAGSPYPGVISNSVAGIGGPFPVSATSDSSFAVRSNWDASLRLRAGFLVTPSLLLYGTGGLALMDLRTIGTCSTVFVGGGGSSTCAPGNYYFGQLGPPVNTQSAVLVGGTVGAGLEGLISPNWTWRAEYRYSDFGRRNFTDVRTCSACGGGLAATPLAVSYSMRVSTQIALVGLAYKFSN